MPRLSSKRATPPPAQPMPKHAAYNNPFSTRHAHPHHVWTAAIVSGLAVVMTGTIAFTALHAETLTDTPTNTAGEIRRLSNRIDRLENLLKEYFAQCRAQAVQQK